MQEVSKIEDADYYILNSCSVTHKSDNEAFYLLRAAKNKNKDVKTIITGCIAQIEKEKKQLELDIDKLKKENKILIKNEMNLKEQIETKEKN